RHKIFQFILFIVIATTFHKTAIIILPLVALTAVRHRAIIAVIVATLGYLLYNRFLEGGMDKLLTNYIEAEYSSQGAAIRVAMNLVPAAIFLLFQKRFELSEQQRKLWR